MADFLLYVFKLNVLAALLIVLVFGVSKFLSKKYSVWWRSWIWLAVSLVLLVPVQIPDYWNVIHIQIPQQVTEERVPAVREEVRVQGQEAAEETLPTENSLAASESTDLLENTSQFREQGIQMPSVYQMLAVVWLAAAALYGLYKLLGSYIVQRELKRWSMPVPDKSLEMNYQKLCRKMKVSHPPKLWMNAKVTTPLLTGLLRPRIYLPSDRYTWKELELLLSHELSHYRHHDLWYKLILQLVCIVYWFNPLLHWMRREADQDLEFLCDERIMKDGAHEERMQYNYLLAQTAAQRRNFYGLSTGFNGSLADLKKRMVNIMRAGNLKKGKFITFCFLAVFVFMNVMTGCSEKEPEDTSAVSTGSVSQSESESDTSAEATPTPETTPEPTQEPLTTEPVATPEPTDVPEEEQNTEDEDTEETQQPAEDTTEETKTDSEDQGGENQQDDSGETMEAVQAKVNVYEGEYRYEYVMTGLVVPEYYKVKVSNVTDTSFDFTIYYVNETEGSEEVVFRTHTAVFVGDGMEAVYDGVDYYLTFTFPDYHEAYPDATDMEISGYGPVEGMTFSNNSIPGHEFS
ncbi:M56 family metallopeptidase [Blautia sp.]|uniref:M56 family metallopeptidase n=1 Tax=Blautia sp. TaxID=1955243 RepID=UPI003AAD9CA3